MNTARIGIAGVAALVVTHCAGMIDLVALPVWVGALVAQFGFEPAAAGGIVTAFLLGAVAASMTVAARIHRLDARRVAAGGFALAALAFAAAATQTGLVALLILHVLAGLSVGAALSMVHGTIGRSANPHRLFAMAGIAIGLFAVVFLGAMPPVLANKGGGALFVAFSAIMAIAALAAILKFPNPGLVSKGNTTPLSAATWMAILGVSLMTFNQSMVFSFVQVIGGARGFTPDAILTVLIALGIINFIFPAPLAALLEKRLPAERVVLIGPAVQAALALVVTMSTTMIPWGPAAACFVAVQIFTHTFAFGLLARLDTTGRAVAATPAMLMSGAALGPIVGGVLGQSFGFGALGLAAVVVAAASIAAFARARSA